MEIKDKVALVTGASSGIGMAAARLLAKNGAKVALAARSKDKLEKLSKELPGSAVFPADMSDETAVKELVKQVNQRFGRIDILVNNAGRGMDCPLETTSIKEYRKLIDLKLIAPLVAMQNVIPIMRGQGGGIIVNISSGTALMYLPGMSAYSSTKRALNGLTLTAREELAKEKIIVSVVYPYVTKTDFYKNLEMCGSGEPETADEVVAGRAPADSAEYVAEQILEVINSGQPEQFVHDWMKKMR